MNERALIQKCKEHDYSAQVMLYNLYKDMMYNVSFRIVKSRADAEDVVQESFIKGFDKIDQIKDEMNLGAWLKRIVINGSLDLVRKRKKEYWIEEKSIVEKGYQEIELEDDSSITIKMIKECLEKLKEKYRIILVLYMIEDYNHREIGEMLKIKESTVRNQYRRGKAKLLEMLQNRQKDEFKRIHTGT